MEKRLKSLKLPRDLTLGGTKPKKVFMPNLNVSRSKDKKEIFIKNEEKQKINQKKDKSNKKKFQNKSDKYVQSSGIFSDGIGSDQLKKLRSERSYSSRDDTSSVMPVPKVKKVEWQVDNKNESKVYDDIMGLESQLDDDDEVSPFALVTWNESDFKETPIIGKAEVVDDDNESIKLGLGRLKIESDIVPKEFQEDELISDYNPLVTLWKMPHSFSGKGLSDDPNVQKYFDYKLSDMLEGQIGKIMIHKSGKIDVFIGSAKYQLEATLLDTFNEKIVSVCMNDPESKSIALGQIQNRYILNPDWTDLLSDL